MGLKEDLEKEVKKIFADAWTKRDGTKVPETEDIKLGNDAVKLEGTVLYADLAESTSLVDKETPEFAAEVYKTYLCCASKAIKDWDGTITAFDGDRVMAVFIGGNKRNNAVRAALKLKYAVENIINPAIKAQYPNRSYAVKHAVGIDNCDLFVARTGVRGSNDLVWVGKAANYAAKLCSLRSLSYTTYITKDIYDYLKGETKYSNGNNMWDQFYWQEKGMTIYRSRYWWGI